MASAIVWQSIKTINDPNFAINVLINKIIECQDKATCITKQNSHKKISFLDQVGFQQQL